MSRKRMVYLKEEKVYANLLSEGAYASRVEYMYGGVWWDVMVPNEEIEYLEEDELEE